MRRMQQLFTKGSSQLQFRGFSIKKKFGKKPVRKFLISVSFDEMENRIVPAALLDARHLVYTDIDGDRVRVVASRPVFMPENVNEIFQFDTGSVDGTSKTIGQQLQSINLTPLGAKANGLNLIISVSSASRPVFMTSPDGSNGDGLVNVGSIDATGINLGTVRIAGDLGRIQAGVGAGFAMAPAPRVGYGVYKLHVNSLGAAAVDTQAPDGNLESVIKGSVGSIIVANNIENASVSILAGQDAKVPAVLDSLWVGGSLIGSAADNSGSIHVEGYLNQFRIRGSIQGSSGAGSGSIKSLGTYRFLPFGITGHVGGDVVGGSGEGSGLISMKGSYRGGIQSVAACSNNMKVVGSLRGGTGHRSGGIEVDGIVSKIEISGDIVKGDSTGMVANLVRSNLLHLIPFPDIHGYISVGYAGNIKVGGSILTGSGGDGGDGGNPAIVGKYGLGNIDIRGSVTGSASQPVNIIAGAAHTAFQNLLSIGRIHIDKDVQNLNVVAGATAKGEVQNADAKIGEIIVRGNWTASSVYAGHFGPGNLGNTPLDSPTTHSAVASVRIGGEVLSPDSSTASGIYAEVVGFVILGQGGVGGNGGDGGSGSTGGNGGTGGDGTLLGSGASKLTLAFVPGFPKDYYSQGGNGGSGGDGTLLGGASKLTLAFVPGFLKGNGGAGGRADLFARRKLFNNILGITGDGGNGGDGGASGLSAKWNWFNRVLGGAGGKVERAGDGGNAGAGGLGNVLNLFGTEVGGDGGNGSTGGTGSLIGLFIPDGHGELGIPLQLFRSRSSGGLGIPLRVFTPRSSGVNGSNGGDGFIVGQVGPQNDNVVLGKLRIDETEPKNLSLSSEFNASA